MKEEHPVVTYLEKEKSRKEIYTFYGITALGLFFWVTNFPFFKDYWWMVTLIGIGGSVLLELIHYFKFDHKKNR